MTAPNFFILGAPRSATTFLYRAVAQHPQVFMSAVKEPGFFSGDQRDPAWVTPVDPPQKSTWEEYLKLFEDGDGFPVRGEASTVYLADQHTAERMRGRLTDPPYLVAVLRNPADRAYSHYVYHRMQNVEPASTFEEALADEPRRRASNWNMQWRYQETGLYSRHLDTYIRIFGRDRLLVLLHEDFSDEPRVLDRLFRFLHVDPDVPIDLEGKVNESGVSKNSLASWILKHKNPVKLAARRLLPNTVRKRLRHQLTDRPPELRLATRSQLVAYYCDDIEKTAELIGRDLKSWLELPPG